MAQQWAPPASWRAHLALEQHGDVRVSHILHIQVRPHSQAVAVDGQIQAAVGAQGELGAAGRKAELWESGERLQRARVCALPCALRRPVLGLALLLLALLPLVCCCHVRIALSADATLTAANPPPPSHHLLRELVRAVHVVAAGHDDGQLV